MTIGAWTRSTSQRRFKLILFYILAYPCYKDLAYGKQICYFVNISGQAFTYERPAK